MQSRSRHSSFILLAALPLLGGILGGAATVAVLGPGQAHAGPSMFRPPTLPPPPSPTAIAPTIDPQAITVPDDGLRFRRKDGKLLAKLSGDANGATLELFNAGGQPRARLVSSASGELVVQAADGTQLKLEELDTRLKRAEDALRGKRCSAMTSVRDFKRNSGYDSFNICLINP